MLAIDQLSKFYRGPTGTIRAVDGVSLRVAAGEFVAVQGPSGCGKTTLLLVAGALLQPDGGQIKVDGQDPYALSPDMRARFRSATIGFVFQQFHLVPYLTLRDNVLTPALGQATANAQERADELLQQFGLAERSRHRPADLSTGERQRVALARALLNRPKLLLADEPTGNLDRDNAEIVLGRLTEFARTGGAVLLVTHDPAAAGHAQRTLTLRNGQLNP